MLRTGSIAALIVMPFLTVVAAAQQDSWVGKKVMLGRPGVVLKGGTDNFAGMGEPVEEAVTAMVYTVLKEIDGWVLVRQFAVEGWFRKDDGVLLKDAVGFFTEQIKANADDHRAFSSRGAAHDALNEHDAALKDLDEAIRLKPNIAAYWNNRGGAHAQKKAFDKALTDFNEAIRLDAKNASAYFNRGHVYHDKRDLDNAIKDYSAVLRIAPNYVQAFINRGVGYFDTMNYDWALADYNEALRLSPKDESALANRAQYYLHTKEYDKAISDCNEAIKHAPRLHTAFINRAVAYERKKEYALATADYSVLTKLLPNYAYGHNQAAWLLATCPKDEVRNGKKAIEHARKACELTGWKNALYKDTLAASYAEDGQFDLAVKYQREALDSATFVGRHGKVARERLQLYEMEKPCREP